MFAFKRNMYTHLIDCSKCFAKGELIFDQNAGNIFRFCFLFCARGCLGRLGSWWACYPMFFIMERQIPAILATNAPNARGAMGAGIDTPKIPPAVKNILENKIPVMDARRKFA